MTSHPDRFSNERAGVLIDDLAANDRAADIAARASACSELSRTESVIRWLLPDAPDAGLLVWTSGADPFGGNLGWPGPTSLIKELPAASDAHRPLILVVPSASAAEASTWNWDGLRAANCRAVVVVGEIAPAQDFGAAPSP